MEPNIAIPVANKFDLKNQIVDLVGHKTNTINVAMPLRALELIRAKPDAVPASKYSLEIICGASCETSAI